MKERQDSAFKSLLGIADTRPAHLHGATHHREVPRFAMTVAIDRPLRPDVPLRLGAANEHIHFFFEQFLNEILNVRSGPTFQGFVRFD